ncbi:uncharacterized protein LOC129303589 [Prosopis cineraria]|uniref:uncharacterized protein LOC129303589 n=1 Tax=Prosopis cineraria TaxID=364024 RepID=UPI00240EA061|nr:uncharacterized protein LOC129303589 [Prosopis cineraria]
MRAREAKPAPSADLLVCFPSRAHLTLMPKPICSPARPSDSTKRHLKKSTTRNGAGAGQASPMLWSKTKSMGPEIAEPTSPKVTCAGQIKVRPKTAACRSWQSVMEEIEKIHHNRKQRKRSSWADSFGFKKEIMQFLTCLRSIKFDLRCFGSFPEADATSEEDDEDDEYRENQVGINESDNEASGTVFSKWFMVLQENQNTGFHKEDAKQKGGVGDDGSEAEPTVPPPNALLLMRCRSAPAKSWLQENRGGKSAEQEKEKANDEKVDKEQIELKKGRSLKSLMDEEKRKRENLVVMKYDSDFYEISSDIAKETWIVGGISDPLSKSRSWKR